MRFSFPLKLSKGCITPFSMSQREKEAFGSEICSSSVYYCWVSKCDCSGEGRKSRKSPEEVHGSLFPFPPLVGHTYFYTQQCSNRLRADGKRSTAVAKRRQVATTEKGERSQMFFPETDDEGWSASRNEDELLTLREDCHERMEGTIKRLHALVAPTTWAMSLPECS